MPKNRTHPSRLHSKKRATAVRPKRAKRFSATLSDRVRAYRDIHVHTLLSSLQRLRETPFSTSMTVVVIAIALAFPTGFYVLVKNIQEVSGELTTNNQISLFLKPDISNEAGARIAEQLKKNPKVQDVKLVDKEVGLKEFQTYSGFGDALDALEFNPLPVVIQVLPDESLDQPAKLGLLLKELETLPEADFAQLDMEWVERLHTISDIAERVVLLLGGLLGIGVIFIVGNTIRLELQNRRDEVVVTKLVGGTDAFIRRPFLYCGFWYGFMSSILAWLIVTITLLVLYGPVQRLSALYSSRYHLIFLDPSGFLVLVVAASILGIAGSWLVLAQHLNRLNPE
jgi:cell division transport system permease protein